jgi:hypothetical protein
VEGEQEWINEQCYVFQNDGNAVFTEIADQCGFTNHGQGRGLVRFDYDNDGDQDIVVFANDEPLMLLRNDLEPQDDRHWIRLFFDTSAHPRLAPNGYGTRVRLTAGDQTWHAMLTGGSTFISQSELSIHVGLGDAAVIDELRIFWNDGTESALTNVPADQTMTIIAQHLCDLDSSGQVDYFDLMMLLKQWGSSVSPADLNADDLVDVLDLLLLLQNWD